jgi:hypothetical protein
MYPTPFDPFYGKLLHLCFILYATFSQLRDNDECETTTTISVFKSTTDFAMTKAPMPRSNAAAMSLRFQDVMIATPPDLR